jgi:hypothetical protein
MINPLRHIQPQFNLNKYPWDKTPFQYKNKAQILKNLLKINTPYNQLNVGDTVVCIKLPLWFNYLSNYSLTLGKEYEIFTIKETKMHLWTGIIRGQTLMVKEVIVKTDDGLFLAFSIDCFNISD